MKTIFNRSARCFLDYVDWHARGWSCRMKTIFKRSARCFLDYVGWHAGNGLVDEDYLQQISSLFSGLCWLACNREDGLDEGACSLSGLCWSRYQRGWSWWRGMITVWSCWPRRSPRWSFRWTWPCPTWRPFLRQRPLENKKRLIKSQYHADCRPYIRILSALHQCVLHILCTKATAKQRLSNGYRTIMLEDPKWCIAWSIYNATRPNRETNEFFFF